MSHRDSLIKTNKELSRPMDLMNVGFVGAAGRRETSLAWSFNGGSTSRVTVGNTNSNTNKFSFSTWAQNDMVLAGQEMLFNKGYTSHSPPYYQQSFNITPTGYIFNLTINGVLKEVGNTITQNTNWHHYAGTYDGTTMKLYQDGVLVDSLAITGTLSNYATNMHIGEIANLATNVDKWTGDIDEFAMYNSALTQSQVTSLYQGGNPNTVAPNNVMIYYDFEQTGTSLTDMSTGTARLGLNGAKGTGVTTGTSWTRP